MGNANDKLIKRYWRDSRSMDVERDKAECLQFFYYYDKNKSGGLELNEVKDYVSDVLR